MLLHHFVAIITSMGKNGGRRGVEWSGEESERDRQASAAPSVVICDQITQDDFIHPFVINIKVF